MFDAVASGVIPAFGMAPWAVLQRVRLTWTGPCKLVDGPAYDLGLSQLSPYATGVQRAFELRNCLRVCRTPEPHIVELRGVHEVEAFRAAFRAAGPSPHGWVVLKTSGEHCICVQLWSPWEEVFKEAPFGAARELDADRLVVLDTSTVTSTVAISADVARAFVWRWACGKTWDAAGVELKTTFAEMAEWMGALRGRKSNRWWSCECDGDE